MDWKFWLLYVVIMPILVLLYVIVAAVAPQLGLFNVSALLWGALASFVIAVPFAYLIAKKIT